MNELIGKPIDCDGRTGVIIGVVGTWSAPGPYPTRGDIVVVELDGWKYGNVLTRHDSGLPLVAVNFASASGHAAKARADRDARLRDQFSERRTA